MSNYMKPAKFDKREAAQLDEIIAEKEKEARGADAYTISSNLDMEAMEALMPPGSTFYWLMKPPNSILPGVNQDKGNDYWGPAPKLVPMSRAGKEEYDSMYADVTEDYDSYESIKSPSTYINIRDMHHWTESPVSGRQRVPMMEVREYSILMNPVINQIMNNLGVLHGNAGSAYNAFKDIMDGSDNVEDMTEEEAGMVEQITNSISPLGAIGGLGSVVAGAFNAIKKVATAAGQNAIEGWNSASEFFDNESGPGYKAAEAADPMRPYKELYYRQPTGFKYGLPYTSDPVYERTNSFGQVKPVKILSNLSEALAEASSSLSLNKMLAPGQYIEKPTTFDFTGREKSYTVNFPLFNTKDFVEIIKNWQFLYLMTYQNTPNRQSKDLILPACIYEAYIPGVWYAKYASITNLSVEFLGARREMEIPLPFLEWNTGVGLYDGAETKGSTKWNLQKKIAYTVIPDAYQVSITFTEMFGNSQNFMYHMLEESMQDKIKVSKNR